MPTDGRGACLPSPWRTKLRDGATNIDIGRHGFFQEFLMRLAFVALSLAPLALQGQSPGPQLVRLADILPAGIRTTQIALTADTKRVYYGDSARAVWLYDRTDKRNVRLVDCEALDLAISPLG